MDYMELEKEYFEPYVVGDMDAYLRYVAHKRQDAVWGDDTEIQVSRPRRCLYIMYLFHAFVFSCVLFSSNGIILYLASYSILTFKIPRIIQYRIDCDRRDGCDSW